MQKFSYNSYAPFCEPGSPHFLVSLPLVVWGNVTVTGLELLPQNGLLNVLGARQRPLQSCGLERGAPIQTLSRKYPSQMVQMGWCWVARHAAGLPGRLARNTLAVLISPDLTRSWPMTPGDIYMVRGGQTGILMLSKI